MREIVLGVIGAGTADEDTLATAHRVGQLLAAAGVTLVCGGLGGVMAAACRGALEAGGRTVGILPGADVSSANPWVQLVLPTDMGHARNLLIVRSARALIAIGGSYGTLSEIAVALKLGKTVISLDSWPLVPGIVPAASPEEAVQRALAAAGVTA